MLLSWLRSKRSARPGTAEAPTQSDSSLALAIRHATDLHVAGHLDAASAAYQQVLRLSPQHFDALHMLGVIALQRGQLGDAQRLIGSALEVNPQDAGAHYNLGMVLRHRGLAAESIPLLEKAFSLAPHAANICGLLASSLSDIGDMPAARAAFVRTAQLAPDDAGVHNNLGAFFIKNGELQAAVASLSRAIAINPHMLPALQNLASTHFALGNIDQCLDIYTRLTAMPGVDPGTFFSFGNAWSAAGNTSLAVQQYQRAIELEPEYAKAHWAIAMSHLQPIYDDVHALEASRSAFSTALTALDHWFSPARAAQGGCDAVGSVQPFFLTYHARDNRPLLEAYGQLCVRLMQPSAAAARPTRAPSAERRKKRVGFASAFVQNHSVWHAITKGWITHLDTTRFEVHVFHLGHAADQETAHARQQAAHFVGNARSVAEWTEAIWSADLDVLIYPDIGMNPLTTQLAAQRLAPVQAASWGHPDTTGLPTIDLFLSAQLLEPPNGEDHYCEKLLRLPNLGVCVEPLGSVAEVPNLQALGLPDQEPLLLCPGQLIKYSPEHDAVWVALGLRLQQHGVGRLVFFRSPRDEISQPFEQRLRRAFHAAGANFDATVCMLDLLPRPQFYGLMQCATMMLDTIGFSGFNTALQCVECGLPLVAFEGEFMRGRLASGLLRRMGLDEWVATSNAAFVDKAMQLLGDPPLASSLRQQIGKRRSVIFNDMATVRALENALDEAIESSASLHRTSP